MQSRRELQLDRPHGDYEWMEIMNYWNIARGQILASTANGAWFFGAFGTCGSACSACSAHLDCGCGDWLVTSNRWGSGACGQVWLHKKTARPRPPIYCNYTPTAAVTTKRIRNNEWKRHPLFGGSYTARDEAFLSVHGKKAQADICRAHGVVGLARRLPGTIR